MTDDLEPAVLATNKHHEDGHYQTFTRPEGEIAEAWRKYDRDFDTLYAASASSSWSRACYPILMKNDLTLRKELKAYCYNSKAKYQVRRSNPDTEV